MDEFYGPRVYRPDAYDTDLLGALIATILSQHTSDLNSGRAYATLKKAFPSGWNDVRQSPEAEIAAAIKCGGLADTKAVRIKRLIQEIFDRTGAPSLEFLRGWDDRRIETFLTGFHGVGSKTAACLLLFNLGRPVIPVDTHVHRVSRRLGLVDRAASAPATQDALQELVAPELAYSFHMHLIEHGRATCHAQRPKCGACPLSACCEAFQDGWK
jgi:endonuclease-3